MAPTDPRRLPGVAAALGRGAFLWALPAIVLAGASLASIRLAEPEAEVGIVERLADFDRGTTWVYDTRTNGEPTGLHVVQVVGGSLMSDGRPATLIRDRYEDLGGNGPQTFWGYVAIRGGRSVLVGDRFGDEYDENVPPVPDLVPPLSPGQTWSYSGTAGGLPESVTIRVDEVGPRTVLGRTITGCRLLHRETTFEDDNGQQHEAVSDGWMCPGVGAVEGEESLVAGDFEFEQELIGFRSGSLSLGTSPPVGSVEAEPGESPGVDAGRSSSGPGELRTDALAWSETRRAALDFAPVGREGLLVMAEEDGWVSAVDTETGRSLWRVQAEGRVTVAPVVAGPLVIIADSEKSLLALEVETGEARWIRRLPDLAASPPVPAGDRIVVAGEDGVVRALELSSGASIWEVPFRDLISEPIALEGDRVLVGLQGGEVAALSASDGESLWSSSLETPLISGPVVLDGLVVVGDDQGLLYGLEAESGDTRWLVNPNGFVDEPVAIGPEHVVLIADRTVQARDPGDGSIRWLGSIDSGPAGPPTIVGEEAVVLTDVGELVRFALDGNGTADAMRLPSPAPDLAIGADVPMQVVGGALAVAIEIDGPWPFGLVLGFPLSDEAGEDGIHPSGEMRGTLAPPIGPVALAEDGSLLFSGADERAWRVPPAGDPVPLIRTGDTAPSFAIPAGDLVLTQRASELVAVPRGGGDPVWTFPMGEPSIGSAPIVVDGTAVVPIRGQGLAGVDVASGETRWVRPIAGQGTSRPLLLPDGDIAYGVGSMVRVDPATGEVRWSLPNVDTFGRLAAGDGAVVEVGFHDNRGVVLSVEAETGEVRWERDWQIGLLSAPATAPGVVVATKPNGEVWGLDAATGEPRWSMELGMSPTGPPLAMGDRVVVTTIGRNEDVLNRDFRLVFLRAEDGRYLGSFEPTGVAHSLAGYSVSGERLLVPAVATTNVVFVMELEWP